MDLSILNVSLRRTLNFEPTLAMQRLELLERLKPGWWTQGEASGTA
jgi:hypothetical protein